MSETRDPQTQAGPSALPATEAELAAWKALSRDEQIARYRAYLAVPECGIFTQENSEDILAAARKMAAEKRG